MKKFVAIAVVALMALPLVGTAAHAGKPKKPVQEVEGSVMFPALFAQGTFDGCWGGLHRRIITPTNGAAGQGVFGYHFEIDKKSWNKPFKLEVTGGQGDVDLDIFLYMHVPPVTEWQNDPVNAGTPVSVDYTTREPGGETGIVPKTATMAIVCLYGGPSHYGYNASFKYSAG